MRSSTSVFCAANSPRWNISIVLLVTLNYLSNFTSASALEPISVTPGTDFLGYDGAWSPVSIRVGSPQQWLSVFPSTLSSETWVIGPSGCDGTFVCQSKRGGLFFSNESTSFQHQGYYELDFEEQLGDAGYGDYGLDTLALDDTVSAADQVVAVINSTDYWEGQLGLGVQPVRFNSTANQLSLLSSLVETETLVPSHSYGYTAGAYYRLKTVPASLTLGGVDTNRFIPNDMNFSLSPSYAPIIAVNGISVSSSLDDSTSIPPNWNSNPTSLLDDTQADLFTIDSSTPFLWLPEAVCENFANALNLTYNETLQLYLFPDDGSSSPETLNSWNLTFTFALNNLPGGQNSLELTLPYDSFNLQLSYPFPNLYADFTSPPSNYFPVRRAANNTQYTIGRVFLQETYLTVDYERNNFSISQALFDENTIGVQNLQAITRPSHSNWPGPTRSGLASFSTAAKAGIGAGVGVLAVVLVILAWFYKRQKRIKLEGTEEKPNRRSLLSRIHTGLQSNTTVSELLGDKRHPTEIAADTTNTRFELPGNGPVEMPAGEVSPVFYTARQYQSSRGTASLRSNRSHLAELEHGSSTSKSYYFEISDSSDAPTPPYSPADVNQYLSNGISPYSLRNSPTFATTTFSEQMVSPIGMTGPKTSRGSSKISQAVSSPISPELPLSASQYFASPISPEARQTTFPSNALLSPLNSGWNGISRSSSQRLIEESIDGRSTASERLVDTRVPSPASAARFSWEI